jgi:hypothetical protein
MKFFIALFCLLAWAPCTAQCVRIDAVDASDLDLQLHNIDLNTDGNNAAFIGRLESEGSDVNNNDFAPGTIVSEDTKWVFVDATEREPLSPNDIVTYMHNFLNNKLAAERMHGKFKLVVIDSGAGVYFMNDEVIQELLTWLAPGDSSSLIFQHMAPSLHQAMPCLLPYILPVPVRINQWYKAEKFILPGHEELSFVSYPSCASNFPTIYVDTFTDPTLGESVFDDKYSFCKDAASRKACLQNFASPAKARAFEDKSEAVTLAMEEYFIKRLQDFFQKHFDTVNLIENMNETNSAPFVKGGTNLPSPTNLWWMLIGKRKVN